MADALASGKKPESARGGDDAFTYGIKRLARWGQNNLRTVAVVAAGLAMVVLGVLYYVNFKESVRVLAAGDLATLRSRAASPETLVPDLEAYIQRFDGTASADEARLLLARTYLDTDRAAEAGRVVAAVDARLNRPVGRAARTLLGAAQEAEGNAEAALATYQSLATQSRFAFQRREAGAAAARVLVGLGRLDEAAAIYATIAEEAADEDPAEAGVYRLRLGEINGRRGAGRSG